MSDTVTSADAWTIRRGYEFVHDHAIEPGYRPGPGETYAGGPKARCRVTHITATRVYYRFVNASPRLGSMYVARGAFLDRFMPTHAAREFMLPACGPDARVAYDEHGAPWVRVSGSPGTTTCHACQRITAGGRP